MGELRVWATVEVFPESERAITRAEVLRGVSDAAFLFELGRVPIDAEVLDGAPGLRLIAMMEIYSPVVDVGAATARGIPVTNLPNIPAIGDTTAELAFGLMIALSRRINDGERRLREGHWHQLQSMEGMGSRLAGKTLGIVGFGSVGRAIARRAQGWRLSVLYHDPVRANAGLELFLGAEWAPLETVFRASDVVILAMPLTAHTRYLVGEHLLSLMKSSALLVNVARGGVLDQEALIRALSEGSLAGAALDVYSDEPPARQPASDPRLLDLPNVVLSPHLGTAAKETRLTMARYVVDNIIAAIQGRRPRSVLNPEIYGHPPLEESHRIG